MLQVNNVTCGYGKVRVVKGVSLQVAPGGLTAVMGHNGAGKTTLLRGIVGLLDLADGQVTLDGTDISKLPAYQRVQRGLAYVPQGQQAFGHLTAAENLQIAADAAPKGGKQRVAEALDLFPALRQVMSRRAGLLSGGQRQQLAIARALVGGPKVMMLDEPTEGIQPSVVEEIHQALRSLTASGQLSVLLVEQHVGFALSMADRYLVVESGRASAEGPGGVASAPAVRAAMAL